MVMIFCCEYWACLLVNISCEYKGCLDLNICWEYRTCLDVNTNCEYWASLVVNICGGIRGDPLVIDIFYEYWASLVVNIWGEYLEFIVVNSVYEYYTCLRGIFAVNFGHA